MGLGFCFVNGCKNNQGSLKKNDDNDKQSVGSEENPGFFDCSTITKKADDEDEGACCYQDVRKLLDDRWLC